MPIRILLLDHRHSLKSCAAVAMDVRVYPPGVTSSKMSAINCHGILPTSAIFLYIACPYMSSIYLTACKKGSRNIHSDVPVEICTYASYYVEEEAMANELSIS